MSGARDFIEGKPIMIDSVGRYWAVTESPDPDLKHLFMGVEVWRDSRGFFPKRPMESRLLRARDVTLIEPLPMAAE